MGMGASSAPSAGCGLGQEDLSANLRLRTNNGRLRVTQQMLTDTLVLGDFCQKIAYYMTED